MKREVEKNIKYIIDNIDELGLSPINKEYIEKIVELLKFQVRSNYIYTSLNENEKLVKHIETVLKTLKDEEDKINKEINSVLEELEFKYKDYIPTEEESVIFPGLKAKLEENRKKNYENEKDKAEKDFEEKRIVIEDKLKELQAQKDTIEDLKDQIVSTKKFIETKLNEEFDIDTYNNNYNSILNECAISILGNDIDLNNNKDNNENKLFIFEDGNYIPNHDVLLDYFETGRNIELSNELVNFYNNLKNVAVNKNIAKINDESYSQSLNKREDIKEAVNDKNNRTDVEEKFITIHDLFNKLKDVHLSKIKNALDTIGYQNKKVKFNILEKFIKNDTKSEEQNDNLNEQDEKSIFEDLIKEYTEIKKFSNYSNSEKMSLVFDFYLMLANSKIDLNEIKKNIDDIPDFVTDENSSLINEISLIYSFIEKYDLDEIHKMINEIIDTKVDEVQNSYEENLKNLNDYKSRENELYDELSDKAKEYHNKFNSEYSLNRFNDLSSNFLSPLIASLIIETILCIDDVKTPNDIHKFGINLTDDEIKEYKKLITNTILPNMENFLNNSMNIIIVNNSLD